MDEPTSALDPISTLKIEDLMGELKKNYTVVIVTHNMQQATRIADYTAFFPGGRGSRVCTDDGSVLASAGEEDGRLYYRTVWMIGVRLRI